MRIERIVIDASPLIILFNSQLADLLPQLFSEIIVPRAVWDEVVSGSITDVASQQLPLTSWVRVIEVSAISTVIAAWSLGLGESEVLTFAWENYGYRVMVDDAAMSSGFLRSIPKTSNARRCSRILGMGTLGTGGMLVLAKRRGLISSVSSCIELVRDAGLWISDEVVSLLKQEAGEE